MASAFPSSRLQSGPRSKCFRFPFLMELFWGEGEGVAASKWQSFHKKYDPEHRRSGSQRNNSRRKEGSPSQRII